MKRILFAVLAFSVGAGAAHAQTLEDRLRSQLVAVTNQLRELQAKQAAQSSSDQEVADLRRRLAADDAEIRALRRQPRAAPSDVVGPLQAKVQSLTQAQAQNEAALTAAQDTNAQLSAAATRLQAENAALKTAVAGGAQSLELCRSKNLQAIQAAKDILAAYRRVSVADVLARKEPMTGLARTRIENLERDYSDRISDSRFDAQPKPAPASAPEAPPPPHRP